MLLFNWQHYIDPCNRRSFESFSFHTTTKLEDHVPWNIFQTCDSFTENLIQMWEPQLWRCWSHSEYEVLVFLSRLCIRPDATHLRPHASHNPAPVYRGQNRSPSCKQADKDNLIDVGAAHWWKETSLTQPCLRYPCYRIRLTTTKILCKGLKA